jgi:hypothetical protein
MVGAGLTLVLGCARSPPTRPHPCTTPPRHEGRPLQHNDLLTRAPDVAAWGGHGVEFAQVRRDAAAVYGETAARRARCAAARRRAHRQNQGGETAHERTRLWVSSRRVGDVVVAGLTKKAARRRCSRRRPASCSGPASIPTRTAPSSPATTGLAPLVRRRSPAAARRRRRDARLDPPRLHSPAPLAAALTRERGKPQHGLVGSDGDLGVSLKSLGQGGARVERAGGAPIGGHGATADVAPHQWWLRRLWRHRARTKRSFPLSGIP